MGTATLSSQGQLTVPKHARAVLNLQAGSVLNCTIDEKNQSVTFSKPEPIEQYRARIASYVKPDTPPLTDVRGFIEKSSWGQE
jgi:bifunctional DNA-binding transcriptional regulator/antitoxin component of YhaV-PrlF toxin-antitoxin module